MPGKTLYALAFLLDSVGLLLCIVALYSYYKLQILKKPPGNLIFIQLIFLFVAQVDEIVELILKYNELEDSDCRWTDLIRLTCYTIGSIYEICIAFEILIRLKSSPMGQKYTRRQYIYHTLCLLGTLVIIITAAIKDKFETGCNVTFKLKFIRSDALFLVSYILPILISTLLIIACIYYGRRLRSKIKAKYLRYNIVYLGIFLNIVVLNFMLMLVWGYGLSLTWIEVLLFGRGFSHIALIAVRLCEPGLRKFIKDRFRSLYHTIKHLFFKLKRRSSLEPSYTINDARHASLVCTVLIDELKQETLEYQLIGISIIMFKNYSKSISILDTTTQYPEAVIYEQIRSHDLEILSHSYLTDKYIDYYCEYKLYEYDTFKQIISAGGLQANEIANSLAVCDNLERIEKYILDDGSDKMIHFVTFDDKFIVKTITKEEQKIFISEKLQSYYDRVTTQSHLQHIYGIFKMIIKGQIYRLMVIENSLYSYQYITSICISSDYSDHCSTVFEHNFIMKTKQRERLDRVLDEDIQYLRIAKMQSAKVFIDILRDKPQDSRRIVYSGTYQNISCYMSMRITEVNYIKEKWDAKLLRRTSVVKEDFLQRVYAIVNSLVK